MSVSKLLLFVFQIIGIYCSNSKRVLERIKHLENRFNTEANFRDEDYADIIDRLDEIDKKLNISLKRSVRSVYVVETPNNMMSENVDKLRDDFTRIRIAFQKEKSVAARFRREIPRIENNLTSLRQDLEHYCTTNLYKTENISSVVENIDEKIKLEIGVHFNELKKEQSELRTLIHNLSMIQREDCGALTEQIERNIVKMFVSLEKEVKETRTIVENNNRKLSSITSKSCNEFFLAGLFKSGVNTLENGLDVFCDQTTDGGGWTVFQRRLNGDVDFYRTWKEYKEGFGDLNGEFWLGNNYLSILTASGDHELRIDIEDFEGNRVFAKYSKFKIFPEEDDYKLEVSGYSGNARDSLKYHNGMSFTTLDNDNDLNSGKNCAIRFHGAWWYNSCFHSNLNGKYFNERNKIDDKGISWILWKGSYCLKFVEMKFRSKS